MRSVKFLSPFFLSFLLLHFLSACHQGNKTNSGILVKEVKDYINPVKEAYQYPDYSNKNCKEPDDTLRQNLPFNYTQAINDIKSRLISVDGQNISPEAKQFIKALICADFVYAAFSYHFPGDSLGFACDTIIKSSWDSLPLNTCYDIGNTNKMAVYCNERTIFYLRLLKSLTGINGKAINSKIHTYPVVFITDLNGNSQPYLADPYDPFISFVAGDSIIPVFSEHDTTMKNIEIHITRRAYGKTRVLVSRSLMQTLNNSQTLQQYCSLPSYTRSLVSDYLHLHPKEDSTLINLPSFPQAYIISDNNRFEYAINMQGRPDGQLFDLKSYKKFYCY